MRKNDFVILMKNLLSPFFGCGDWFLLSSNFVLDENHILIDTDTFSVKYIYLPLKQQVNTTEKIMEFFENFIVRCELVDDPAFLMRLLRVIKTNSVSLKPLYDEINTAAGRNDNRSGSDSASMNAAPVQPVPVQQAPAPAPAPAPVPTPASAPAKPASPFSFKKAEPAPAPAPMAPMPQAPAASVKQAAENSRENDLMANLFGGAAVEKSKPAKQPKPQKEKPVKEKKSGCFLRFDKKHYIRIDKERLTFRQILYSRRHRHTAVSNSRLLRRHPMFPSSIPGMSLLRLMRARLWMSGIRTR